MWRKGSWMIQFSTFASIILWFSKNFEKAQKRYFKICELFSLLLFYSVDKEKMFTFEIEDAICATDFIPTAALTGSNRKTSYHRRFQGGGSLLPPLSENKGGPPLISLSHYSEGFWPGTGHLWPPTGWSSRKELRCTQRSLPQFRATVF